MKPAWYKISLLFFLVVAVIGTLMRAFPFVTLSFNYSYFLHSHSHVAFQGWIYTIMFLLLTAVFLSEEQTERGHYPLQFKLTIPVISGILISFAQQGYGFYSILISVIFQALSFWFIFSFFRDSRKTNGVKATDISLKFIYTGFWLGILSNLGPIAIGILSSKGLADTEWYFAAVYFFLHFQYNGWFLFVALGLLLRCLEVEHVAFNLKKANIFYWLFTIAIIPAYCLSLLGMSFSEVLFLPAIIAAGLQLIGLIMFSTEVKTILKWVSHKNSWFRLFLMIALISFAIKIILQTLSVLPALKEYAFGNRDLIMAYMHLSLIGLISFIFISLLFHYEWLKTGWLSKSGSILLIVGFLASEVIMVVGGLGWIQLREWLILFSAVMALGILFLVLETSNWQNDPSNA